MNSETFERVYRERFLHRFCNVRGYSMEGFVQTSLATLAAIDADDFLAALQDGLVEQDDRGIFRAPLSKCEEQIFWQGRRASQPRRVSLWHEPIITIASLLRLKRDHGWPNHQLGLQSKGWAFDLVGYDADGIKAHLVGEVKKTTRELDALLSHMTEYWNAPVSAIAAMKPSERNAFKKVLALRELPCTVFWAIGPNRQTRVFRIERGEDVIKMQTAELSALRAP